MNPTTKLYQTQLIEHINKGNMYGSIIETGCGQPVAHNILLVSGASNTVYMSECPYSDEYVAIKYKRPSTVRSVSKENVQLILNYHINHFQGGSGLNMVYVASFQVGDVDKPQICTHGWIGIYYLGTIYYYHITIREPKLPRSQLIELIGLVGIELLWLMTTHKGINVSDLDSSKSGILNCGVNIDGIIVDNLTTAINVMSNSNQCVCYDQLFDFMKQKQGQNDGILLFNPDGTIGRIDELVRTYKSLIVYKGSFNPPTIEHCNIAKKALDHLLASCVDTKLVFMISINTVDKGTVDITNIRKRIKMLNTLNFAVVINYHGQFQNAINLFKLVSPDLVLTFPVGSDTISRIEKSLLSRKDVFFHEFPRTPISSTRIRNLLDELDTLVPKEIKNLVCE